MALTETNFVVKAAGVVGKAAAAWVISGVNLTYATYDSDNETVAKKDVEFYPASLNREYAVTVVDGTITAADEGKFFDLKTSLVVDGATESATTGQVQMIKFISATECVFKIVNG